MSTTDAGAAQFAYDSPADALAALLARLAPVSTERIPLDTSFGRILAQAVATDRPSPPADVSAMDGYALRTADLQLTPGGGPIALPVAGEVRIGHRPPALPDAAALRIVTGAPLPPGADAVVKREDVTEHADRIEIAPSVAGALTPGVAIRRRAENAFAGVAVLAPGAPIGPPQAAALATVGIDHPEVYRALRVALLVTGDELLSVSSTPTPWQIRDSNGPALSCLLANLPWLCISTRRHAADDLGQTVAGLREALADADAVIITGGVSMGVGEGCTCATLKEALGATAPALRGLLPGARVAVNSEFAGLDQVIREGDEVALIGMVSGG